MNLTFIHLHHSLEEEKKTQIKMKFKHSESTLQDYNNSKPELPTPGIYSKHHQQKLLSTLLVLLFSYI